MVAALFQFPGRLDALAMRVQLRNAMRVRGAVPGRVPEVTGGELYLLETGGGEGQLVMFVCNERVLQLHVPATDPDPDPLLVQLAQGANRRLHERTGCPLVARQLGNTQRVAVVVNCSSRSMTPNTTRGCTVKTGFWSGSGNPEPYLCR